MSRASDRLLLAVAALAFGGMGHAAEGLQWTVDGWVLRMELTAFEVRSYFPKEFARVFQTVKDDRMFSSFCRLNMKGERETLYAGTTCFDNLDKQAIEKMGGQTAEGYAQLAQALEVVVKANDGNRKACQYVLTLPLVVAARSDKVMFIPSQELAEACKAARDKLEGIRIAQEKMKQQLAEKLAEAEKEIAAKRYPEAIGILSDLAKRTDDAGKRAAQRLRSLETDPQTGPVVRKYAMDRDCRAWLSVADNYIKAGMTEKAELYLQKMLAKYPDTQWAERAKDRLKEIGAKK